MIDELEKLPSGVTPQKSQADVAESQADVAVSQEGGASKKEKREILTKKIVKELRMHDRSKELPNIMKRNIERFTPLPGEDYDAFLEWKRETKNENETYTRVAKALAAYWDETFPDDTVLALADENLRNRIRRWLDFFFSNKNTKLLVAEYFQQLNEGKEDGENPFFPTALAYFALGDGVKAVQSLLAALEAEGVETVGGVPINNLTLAQILAGINEGPIKRNLKICLEVISEIRAAHPDMEREIDGGWMRDPSTGEMRPVTSLDSEFKNQGLVWSEEEGSEEEGRYVPKPPTPSH